jgi:phosphoribosylformimino-5-aminoimidazole carboxamide ribotide isomerase
LWDLLDSYQDGPLKHVLCTNIARDGTLTGPDIPLYQQCQERYPALEFQASGGIASLNDLRHLANKKLAGAIIGKALYEQKFSVSEALAEVRLC